MATNNDAVEESTGGLGSALAGLPSFLFDPEGAAKKVYNKWLWLAALLVLGAIGLAVGLYLKPIIFHVIDVSPPQDGVTPEQQARGVAIGKTFAQVFIFLGPILTALFWVIDAAILLAIGAITGAKARFPQLLNLVAGCWAVQTVGAIATVIILHFKGEITTQAELKPAMGLDILMPEGTNKYLMALGGSFSVFQIWWVVMMALVYAAAFRTSKGKAFATVLPLWILGALFGLLGAVFTR